MARAVALSPSILTTVLVTEKILHNGVEGILWNEPQGVVYVPPRHDDGGARNRERAETERAQPITVVKRQGDQCNWNVSGWPGLVGP